MAFQSIRLLQLFFVSCAALQYGLGFDVRMNVVPDHLDALTPTSNMTITCMAPDSFQSRKEVLVMEVGKADDIPMAIVRQNLALTVRDGLPTNMLADGRVRNNSNSNFIRLTITNPGCQDVGTYSCQVFFLDEIGVMKEEKVKASVTMSNTGVSSVIDDLKDKITSLETRANTAEDTILEQKNTMVELRNHIEKQSLELKDYETKLTEQVKKSNEQDSKLKVQDQKLINHQITLKHIGTETDRLKNEIWENEKVINSSRRKIDVELSHVKSNTDKISYLEDLTRNQSMLISATHERKAPVEAFTALYDQKDKLHKGKVLVFSKVQLKEGNGYDEKTGVFSAPRKGLYVFHLTIATKQTRAMDNVDIEVNDKPQAKVFAYDIDMYAEQSSVSLTVKLQKGDTVKAVFLNNISVFLNSLYKDPYYSVFTGYLLREL